MADLSRVRTVNTHDIIDLQLVLKWNSERGCHQDIRHFPDYNVWRDLELVPEALQHQILDKPAEYSGSVRILPGQWLPEHLDHLVFSEKPSQFSRRFRGHEMVPQLGRFYPRGILNGVPGVFADSVLPMRIIGLDEELLTCDLNHPLAGHDLEITSTIKVIQSAPEERGGRCQDAVQYLLQGPGMQVRAGNQPTDFFAANSFRRMDERADSAFYSMPRMVDHLDASALRELKSFYASVLTPESRVLDLMASFDSHLSDEVCPLDVVGIGLNSKELAANPILTEHRVHDLNKDPALPFSDARFDAVICSLSVEYLIRPLEVFHEVIRVLKPGGIFATTFSNRWFPPKAISIWVDLHEFERMGLVGEYFLLSGGFSRIHTWSLRGLKRPDQDKYRGQLSWSDPLYAVWARKETANGKESLGKSMDSHAKD